MRTTLFVALVLAPALAPARRRNEPPPPEQRPVSDKAIDTVVYSRLRFRYIGPEGNRISTVTGIAGDPSVIYAALLEHRYRGTIYQSDLQAESAYNTYRHTGLPPGPIGVNFLVPFLLIIRLLPVISIFETKEVLHEEREKLRERRGRRRHA